MNSNWILFNSVLPDAFISKVIERCEQTHAEDGRIGGSIENSEIRESEVRWVSGDSELRNVIWNYANAANADSFGFDLVQNMFAIQHTTYYGKDNGHYGWHEDIKWIGDNHYSRKLSMSIQLCDPSEYEGGKFEFEIDGQIVSPDGFEKKGSILVFPSFLKHRVTPVTKGTRKSIVSWVEGPNFR